MAYFVCRQGLADWDRYCNTNKYIKGDTHDLVYGSTGTAYSNKRCALHCLLKSF